MENTTGSYDKISPTAKLTAYLKSKTDIQWAREIADAVGAEKTAGQLTKTDDPAIRSLSVVTMEARYKSISYAIEKSGYSNVLELASGLSPRGLELAARGKAYVGTDLPDTATEVFAVIRQIAKRENIPGEKLHLQPADVFDQRQLQQAGAHFGGEPFAVCNEGLLMYFNRQEKAKAARNIRQLLLKTDSVWITTDLAFHELMMEIMHPDQTNGRLKEEINRRSGRLKSLTGRNILENRFSSPSEAIEFYKDLGFEIRDYPMYAGNYALSTLRLVAPGSRAMIAGGLTRMKVWVLKAAG
jgi:O-methyltransferase involved in polyketide biosynthesis